MRFGAFISFISQRDHWVHFRRATRRQKIRNESDRAEHDDHDSKGERVARADTVKQALEKSRERERRDQSRSEAEQCKLHSGADDQSENVSALRAKREPDSEFARALRDRVGNDAVQSERRESQRNRRESAEKRAIQTAAGDRLRNHAPQRFDPEKGQRRIDLAQCVLDRLRQRRRIG